MKTTGRCYCGSLKYEISGQAEAAFQCHCRECQYITGGNPNIVMVFPKNAFRYVEGIQKSLQELILRRLLLDIFAKTAERRWEPRAPLVQTQ